MKPLKRRKDPAGYASRAARRATLTDTTPSSVHHLAAPGRPRAGEGGRWGLVLGGGGVLGVAWLIGALAALEKARGLDARDAEIIVGTSAGSVVGALLAAGVPVEEQSSRQLGTVPSRTVPSRTVPSRTVLGDLEFDADRAAGIRPPRPRLRPGSPQLLRHNRGAFRQVPALALLSGLAPTGRARLDDVARLIEHAVPAGEWPTHPGYRAVALDYETGRRTVFGAPSAPRAGLSEAVLASCAIPGWFQPITIQGRRYVDGGMWSATNADLLTEEGLDELFILSPMAATAYDSPTDWRVKVERRIRVRNTRRCLAEARAVNARGTQVTVITPGPEELALMGFNLMHPARRKVLLETATRATAAALGTPDNVPDVVDLQVGADAQEREEAEPA